MDLYADELLTTKEAAAALKISIPNLKRIIYRGKLVASKVGWQWRIRRSEIATFLEINTPRQ